jgi:hypothetical protein
MNGRTGISIVFVGTILLLIVSGATLLVDWNRSVLLLPADPKSDEVLLTGTFPQPGEICIRTAYAPCGRFCTVPEGSIMVQGHFDNDADWIMELGSTIQIAQPTYRETRYHSQDRCITLEKLERFSIKVILVDVGLDTEVTIQLEK